MRTAARSAVKQNGKFRNAKIIDVCCCIRRGVCLHWDAAAAWSSTLPFDEKDVAAFYKGKTVRIIVGFPAGGGYDSYSRVIGRHLGKHLPGSTAAPGKTLR
jgi:hypothetical protein